MVCGLLFGWCLLVSGVFAEELQISVYVNKTTITINETITYTVEIEGTTDFPDVPPPPSDNFIVVAGPSRSSSIQVINGEVSSALKVSWHLSPTRTGELVIDPIEIKYQSKTYRSTPIKITVLKSGSPTPPKSPTGNQSSPAPVSEEDDVGIFLKAVPIKTEVYKGEEITVTYYLYYRENNVRTFSLKKLPDAEGFWMENYPSSTKPKITREIVDGVSYYKAQLQRLAFFPTKSGNLSLDPLIINCEVIVPRQRSESIFDDFFSNSFFESTVIRAIASQPIEVNVKPLPEQGKPAEFSGIVGNYSITATLDTLVTTQGQALTLEYQIQGDGNINAIAMPPLQLPSTLEVFEPKSSKTVDNTGNRISGIVNYEYVIIPRVTGVINIPAQSLCYFDPAQEKYVRRTSRSFMVQVQPQSRRIDAQAERLGKQEIDLLDSDIRFIHRQANRWFPIARPVTAEWWFWLINSLSLVILGVGLFVRYASGTLIRNNSYIRKRSAWSRAQNNLKAAERAVKEQKSEQALFRLDYALTGFVASRYGQSSSGLGLQQVQESLTEAGVNEKLLIRTLGFLDRLGVARFSPDTMDTDELKAMLIECRRVLDQLSKVI
jgi:hypothetical protein